jgi:hypothetical protein
MPRWIGAVVFFSVAAVIWFSIHLYLYFRVSAAVDLGGTGRTVIKVALVGLALSYLLGRVWRAGATRLRCL